MLWHSEHNLTCHKTLFSDISLGECRVDRNAWLDLIVR